MSDPIAIIGGGLGVAAALATLLALERAAESEIAIYPAVSVALVVVSVVLATGSALVVAWRPVRARPLDVLRSE